MYQILVPVGMIGIVIYLNNYFDKHNYSNNSLHNGTFDDFYIIDSPISMNIEH